MSPSFAYLNSALWAFFGALALVLLLGLACFAGVRR